MTTWRGCDDIRRLTDSQLVTALRNVGCRIDDCDACAENFFTGSAMHEHTCGREEAKAVTDEKVDHPKHYNSHPSRVEAITVIEHMTFNLGSATKYIWRHGLKPGADAVEDLKKARWYIDREITRLSKTETKADIGLADAIPGAVWRVVPTEASKRQAKLLNGKVRWSAVRVDGTEVTGLSDSFKEAVEEAMSYVGAIRISVDQLDLDGSGESHFWVWKVEGSGSRWVADGGSGPAASELSLIPK